MSQMHYLVFNIDLEILHKILHYKKLHCKKNCIAKNVHCKKTHRKKSRRKSLLLAKMGRGRFFK
jgi:hypothetical protein